MIGNRKRGNFTGFCYDHVAAPLAVEEPTLLKDIIAIYRKQLGYDSFELAQLLFMNDPQFFDDREKPRLMRFDGKPFFAFSAA